jgi:hypothetical protein
VSLIGTACVNSGKDEQQKIKKLMNSNVAVEYGFALRALGDNAILMIQNRHYGESCHSILNIRPGRFSTVLRRAQPKQKSMLSEHGSEPSL